MRSAANPPKRAGGPVAVAGTGFFLALVAAWVAWVPAAFTAPVAPVAPAAPAAKGAGRVVARPAGARPNLVLLTLDTTRADHLGAWGWKHARTPVLDALAARGTRFSDCDTAAPITLVSHASVLTGLYPPGHGIRDNITFSLPGKIGTVPERLAAAGYDTAAVVSAIVLARRHGLDRGFRRYDDDLGAGYAAGNLIAERPADRTTAAALAVAADLKPPFFLWVHYYDPHKDYTPPSRFTGLGGPNRLYDGEIAFMDEQIGELLKKLPPDTDVVVVGDHGEMLGEHGESTHGLLLFEGARRVPLLLSGPDVPAGRVHDGLVRTVDVAPTLLSLARVAVPPGLDGQSLLPLPAPHRARESYTESFLPFFAYHWYPLRALSDQRVLYLNAPKDGLFDLRQAKGEERDVAAAQAPATRLWEGRMRALLDQRGEKLEAEVRAENVLSEEQRKQFQSLGYLGHGGGGKVARALPDPRRMTDVAQALDRATEQVQAKNCRDALPALKAIVDRDPQNYPALSLAGFCVREAGRVEDALALFRRASEANELSPVPVADAAGCLKDLGQKKEAEREYRRALALDPTLTVAVTNLARLLHERNAGGEAVAVLDAAVTAGAHAPQVYFERGTIRGEKGNFKGALADFRESARRDPANPAPLENAARAAYQAGSKRESAELYEQLLRVAPSRLDAWKTLGALYFFELAEPARALPAFRRALTLETDPGERAQLEEMIGRAGG